jgi:hypothetical protein
MIWDRSTPCKSCPYRKDAPLKLWHRVEFLKLLHHDRNEVTGALFGCHEFNKRPSSQHRPCAGWLLDQKRRGVPSIQLRLALLKSPTAAACFNAASATGMKLFRTIQAMCRANGVRS